MAHFTFSPNTFIFIEHFEPIMAYGFWYSAMPDTPSPFVDNNLLYILLLYAMIYVSDDIVSSFLILFSTK